MSALLPELERDLVEAAGRWVPHARRARAPRLRLAIAIVLVVLTAAAALAVAGVIPMGAPVKDPQAAHRRPDVGVGIVPVGGSRLLDVRTDDPDGGPPWGLRELRTTRGLGCLQIGRVVDGRLGVLGRDGLFHDDGRFHPLPADLIGPSACSPLDRHGRLFTHAVAGMVPTAGTADGACFAPHFTRGVPATRLCPEADERMLYLGTFGPRAVGLTYTAPDGSAHDVALRPPYGAYLIVARATRANRFNGLAGGGPIEPLNTPITEVRFADSTTCALTPRGFAGGRDACRVPGYEPLAPPRLTTRDVRSPVRVRVEHRAGGRLGLIVSFRARVAVTDASSAYTVTMHDPVRRNMYVAAPVARNVAAGGVVSVRLPIVRRGLRYHGTVLYSSTRPGFHLGPTGGLVVGRWSIRPR
jgi:hypothetical protein